MDNIILMALGAIQRIQGYKPYQLYESNPDKELYDFHIIEATTDLDGVPLDALKSLKWVREHELSMSLVNKLQGTFATPQELLFSGNPDNHFDLWVSPDLLSCRLVVLTRKKLG